MRSVSLVVAVLSSSAVLPPCSKTTQSQAPARDGGAPPTAAAAPTSSAPSAPSAIALGSYACTHDYWTGASPTRTRRSDPTGSVTLIDDGRYRFLDDGGTGRYQLDGSTRTISWLDGPLADKKPRRTTYRRNVRTTQIDVVFADGFDWSCGHDL
jgi:hypothetical protein